MKQVQGELGGRPFSNDDLILVQQELTAAAVAAFLGKGAFIVSGCQVSGPASGATITAGIVCLDGQLLRFAGQSGAVLPAQLQAGAVIFSSPRPYEIGGTRNCMREVPAVLVAANASYTAGEFIPLDVWGGKRWEHVQRASIHSPNEIQWVGVLVATDYANGVGKPGTEAWGWGLCDGKDGRADLLGRVPLGYDSNRSKYSEVGHLAGLESVQLTAAQNAKHTHSMASAGSHVHTFDNKVVDDGSDIDAPTLIHGAHNSKPWPNQQLKMAAAGDHVHVMEESGNGEAHENMQPYTVLVARQWIGYQGF